VPPGVLRELVEQKGQPLRVLVGRHAPPQQDRQRHQSKLDDVSAAVQPQDAVGRRRDDAKVRPEPVRGQLQLTERRAEHVFNDDHTAIRRQHDPIGRQRAVCDILRV